MKSRSQIQREIKIARESFSGMGDAKVLARHKDLTQVDLDAFKAAHKDFITDPDDFPGALGDYVRECQGLGPAGSPAMANPQAITGNADGLAYLQSLEKRIAALESAAKKPPKRKPGRPRKQQPVATTAASDAPHVPATE